MATVTEQLKDATAKIADLEAQVSDRDKSLAEAQVALKAIEAEFAALKETVAAKDGLFAEAEKASQALLKMEQDAHAATKSALEKAKIALSDPAFLDAAIKGLKAGTAEGGSAASAPMTKAEALAEYGKIPASDARGRADFRKNHAKELGL